MFHRDCLSRVPAPVSVLAPRRAVALTAAAALSLALVAPTAHAAGRQVQLGRADDIALDQPRVYWTLNDAAGNVVGPGFDLYGGVLDTGANGVLVGQLGYFSGVDFDPNLYQQARRPDRSIVQYEEIGVAGTELFDVFVPYTFAFTSDGVDEYAIEGLRGFGSMDVNLGSFNAVVGMPAMRGRVVNINTSAIAENVFVTTTIKDTPAPTTAHSYRVRLDMLPAEHTPPVEPGDPTPTFADLPLVRNVTTGNAARTSTSTILLDTGAQFSMISTTTANALGINLNEASPDTDVLDHLEVGGIGGSIEVPLVMLDRLVIPTEGGTDLVLTDLLVGVIDIPTIGGIFGMNLLTSGQSLPEDLGGNGEPGYFDSVELDFRDPATGVMTLNVNPAFDVVRRTLTWAGAGSATNWVDALPTAPFNDANGVRQAFVARDYVRFTDAAAVTTVNVAAAVNPDWVFVDNTAKAYTFTGAGRITGNARLTKTGTGHLRVQTANDYTGPTDIAGGSVAFAARQNIGTVDVRSGATATFETSQRFTGLDVGGVATITPHAAAPLKTVALTGAGLKVTGRLDLTDNALAVRPVVEAEQTREQVLEQVTALIVAGRDGGATKWTGNGLVSSAAAANPSTTLGVAINENAQGATRFASLGGESLTVDDVIVRWTFAGDADLNGAVDLVDFSMLASNFGRTGETWATGDFDLSGAVDLVDFSMLANNFGKALPGSPINLTQADWAALEAFGATVPEPAGVALLLFGAGPVAARRRRRR